MLSKQLVPVDFGALDEKTEAKKLTPGGMTRVVNAERNKTGRYDKCTGYATVTNSDQDSAAISNTDSLGTTKRDLFQSNGANIYQYIPSTALWQDRGEHIPTKVKTKLLSANRGNSVIEISSASNDDYTCIVYTVEELNNWSSTSNYYVYATIVENDTDTVLSSGILVDTSSATTIPPNAQVIWADPAGVFAIFANRNGGDLAYFSWAGATDPDTWSSAQTTITSASRTTSSGKHKFKLHYLSQSDDFLLVYVDSSGNLAIEKRDGGNTSFNNLEASTATASTAGGALCVVQEDNNNYYIFYEDVTAGIEWIVVNSSISITTTATQLTTDANTGAVIGHKNADNSIQIFWNEGTSDVEEGNINGGTLSGQSTLATDFYLQSSPFSYSSTWYFLVSYASTVQPTYFVVRGSDFKCIAKINPEAGPSFGQEIPSIVGTFTATKFAIPTLRAIGLDTDGNTAVTRPGAAITTLEFKTTGYLPHLALGDHALIAGGYLHLFDGANFVENGFHLYPEIELGSSSNGSGSLTNSGVYQWKAVFEWTDANGKVHRSAPSPAVSNTLGASDDTQALGIKGYITDKSNVTVVYYRTIDSGSTFYRLPSITSGSDGEADADITDNEILYTAGGELENKQPPACGHLSLFRDRVFCTDLENGSKTWFSKLRINTEDPYSFSDLLQLVVGDAENTECSIALDDKLLFFKKTQLLYTYGEGPDNLGVGAFAEAVDVNFDGGIAEPLSLVKFNAGVIFKHQRGFYAMGADLNPFYIGKGVEEFNDETVTSAVLIPGKNQIRWTHSAGSAIVYDYFHKQWYEFSGRSALSSIYHDGNHYFVITGGSGAIRKQDDTVYKVGSVSYNFLVQTGWISFAGLSGFTRIYKIFFEGEYKSDHDLTVTVDMEQDGTVYTDTYTIDAATVSGGSDTYRWEVQLSRQKCSSIRVKVEDTLTDGSGGTHQALNLTNMSFLVGVKRGGPKYASSKQVG